MPRGNPYLWAIGGALLLLSFALYNGFPIVFEDTVGYLQRPARILDRYGIESEWGYARRGAGIGAANAGKAWLSGRSVYYGTFNAILAAIGSSWLIVSVQAYIVAAVIAVPWFRSGGGGVLYLATVMLLSVTTSASVFVATLLPDILTAVAVLAVAATLALAGRLSRRDTLFLTVALSCAALSHDSILLSLLTTLALLAIAMAARPVWRAWPRLMPLAISCAAGILGSVLFWLVAIGVTGETPMRLPHLTAKLATSTEGRTFLKQVCPERRFAVCAFQDQVGRTGWIPFLFSRDPRSGVFGIADTGTKRALSEEQVAFVAAMVTHDPKGVTRLQLRSTVELLSSFTVKDLDVSQKRSFFALNLSPALHSRISSTRTYASDSRILQNVSRLTYVAVAVSLFVLAATWLGRQRAGRFYSIDTMAALMVAGVVLNAIICANVAGVYDRFQARVVWLIPLAAVMVLLPSFRKRRSSPIAVGTNGNARL